ncbi:MAG: RNA-binding protein [Gammaproteobacteria bacterium]|nr:MAG: RNA-binding protein [Gammaproteobacteria bacterium]
MEKVRLDKWLWAARFFKTRKLATDAIKGGKIRLNGARPKPSKDVEIGFEVVISYGAFDKAIVVKNLSDKRGPAKVAITLYEETAESIAKRESQQEIMRIDNATRPKSDGKPNKRERRKLSDFKKGGGGFPKDQ